MTSEPTRQDSRGVLRFGFECAIRNGRRRVTIAHRVVRRVARGAANRAGTVQALAGIFPGTARDFTLVVVARPGVA